MSLNLIIVISTVPVILCLFFVIFILRQSRKNKIKHPKLIIAALFFLTIVIVSYPSYLLIKNFSLIRIMARKKRPNAKRDRDF